MKYERPLRATHHCRHYSYDRGTDWLDGGPRCARGLDLNVPGSSACCMPAPNGPCTLREEYTDDERAAWKVWTSERMDRLGKAVQALPRAIPLRTGGTIECPNCGGRLRYDRWHRGAAIQCETENCCGAQFNIAAGAEWPVSKEPAR